MEKRVFELFAVTALGLEAVCAGELSALSLPGIRIAKGGVCFSGGLEELYRANLWLRSASRVVVRLGGFACRDFPAFYRKTLQLPWGRFVRPGTPLQVRATSHRSRLQHTGRIAETLRQAVDRALGGVPLCTDRPQQLILVRFEDNQCQISIDSSGALLHRRGYRTMTGPAPLRETLAAGILMSLDWTAGQPLVDPMCGSGTFVIEAALLGMGRAPGISREFAFMHWPRYRPGLWQVLRTGALSLERPLDVPLIGRDQDNAAIALANANAQAAGAGAASRFEVAELGTGMVPDRPGLMVCNPPYGQRLGRGVDLARLYRRLGAYCRESCKGWRVAVVCPVGPLGAALGPDFQCHSVLYNGGMAVGLHVAHP